MCMCGALSRAYATCFPMRGSEYLRVSLRARMHVCACDVYLCACCFHAVCSPLGNERSRNKNLRFEKVRKKERGRPTKREEKERNREGGGGEEEDDDNEEEQ